MDRQAWLRERRQTAEERYDAIHAFTYDDEHGEIGPTHRRFVADLLERCPPGGTVLDAACGTGRYFAMVTGSGRRVVGTDAMEHVPPEDWPRVLANLGRAVRPGGPLYLTVEQADDRELADATARGLPAVRGEVSRDGYHFHPSRDQVDGSGDGYLHLLVTGAGREPG